MKVIGAFLFIIQAGAARAGGVGGGYPPPASECLALVFSDFGGFFDDLSPIS